MTTIIPLNQLYPNRHGGTIRVRVCRVWKNKMQTEDEDYSSFDGVLVDARGDSIHFTTDIRSLHFFETELIPGKIYCISGFYARTNRPTSIVVDFRCMLEFRQRSIHILHNDQLSPDIPTHKFDLVDFNQLRPRRRNHRVLTDVIGHLKGAQPLRSVSCDKGMRLEDKRDVFIQNIRGEEIKITLWGEQARAYNQQSIAEAQQPIIVVFTSTKVTDFMDELCLASSPATIMFINPQIPQLIPYKQAFAGYSTSIDPIPIPGPIQLAPHEIIRKTKTTLKEMQLMNPEENRNKAFFCQVKCTDVKLRQGWYYHSCPKCPFSLKDRDGTACQQHGVPINGPIPTYKIELVAEDETEDAIITFIGKPVENFIGQPASKYATNCKELDDKQLPQEIADKIIGKTLILQVRFGAPKHSRTRSDIVVTAAVDPETMPQEPPLKTTPTQPRLLQFKGSSSGTNTDNPVFLGLHTPELHSERSLIQTSLPTETSTSSAAKKALIFFTESQTHDQRSAYQTYSDQQIYTDDPSLAEPATKKIKTSNIFDTFASNPLPPDEHEN